jgi:CheY-like chemotaxis protein
MFSQVDRSIGRATGGLGIGLALVKGLIELHGGTVEAESEGAGKGSTFTVRLPALGTIIDPVGSDSSEHAHPTAYNGRRILVVDDNRDSAVTLAEVLKLLGNELRMAHNGVEAFESANEFRPDVILMDVGMPGESGYEVTRRIREQPWGQHTMIIALTGWGQEGDRIRSSQAGCNGHLVKPVSLTDLQTMLAEKAGRS